MALKGGPKVAIAVPPLTFTGWPRDRAKRRMRFIQRYVKVTKGVGAGTPFELRAFQKRIIEKSFAPGVRTSVVSMPRANGKTALAAALAVAELWVGGESAEVLVVASDERQAKITMNLARRMIELNPELAERTHVYKDRIVVPETNSTLIPLPADPNALHGWDPSLLIVDELHTVTEKVWEAVSSVSGKRPESLTLAISTPASTQDSIMWRLVEHGREGGDDSFSLIEYSAPSGCLVDDRQAWRQANPALTCTRPFLAEDGILAAMRTLREPVFRQLRLGQWVAGQDTWLPFGAFDEVKDAGRRVSGRVVLGFDGSASGDSTALIGATVEAQPHVFVVGLWENPGDRGWRVPRGDVQKAIETAFHDYQVVELACDPWGWRSEMETWQDMFGVKRVIEFNTGYRARMAPATDRLYQAIVDHKMTHDGNPDLARHVANTKAVRTPQGDVVQKEKRMSPRKIDATVAMIVAFERASFHAGKKKSRKVVTFR